MQTDDSTRELAPMRTLAGALLYLARIGDHLKQNGPPGWTVLARGYNRLAMPRIGRQSAQASGHQ
jgi:hypothetical protein